MDSLIKTKNHNTASFYPQNRGPVSLRKNKGLPPILYLDGHVDATDVLKTIQGRTWNNMQDWRGTANGRWSDDPELKETKKSAMKREKRVDNRFSCDIFNRI